MIAFGWFVGARHALRHRWQLSLLAAGASEGQERAAALDHLDRCAECRREYEDLRAVVSALADDPLRSAEPALPVSALLARVGARLDEVRPAARSRPRLWLAAMPVAAVLAVLAVIVPLVLVRMESGERVARAPIPAAEAGPLVSEQALRRIERNLAREQTARYLSDASDVLVTATAGGGDCDRKDDRLDVGAAPERSRELLEKRRLVESGGEAVASARFVLDDVEMALREVAELPSCVRRRDVERVRQQLERRRLLMRIRLMTRELEG